MLTAPHPLRFFVDGQLIEYWEHPDIRFGWSAEDLQNYADREDWLFLFNAIVLTAPRPATEHAS
jgi:hypothetical protein